MAKLFIVGFPKDMEEIELVEMFSAYGSVKTVTIITDKNSGESKGYGFITMTDQAGADRAVAAMDGAEIDERKISVRIAEDKSTTSSASVKKVNPKPFASNGNEQKQPDDLQPPRKKRPRRPI